MKFLLLLLLSCAVVSLDHVKTYPDIAYVEGAGSGQTLDVYAPNQGGKHPTIVWIHGGGWSKGDKSGVQKKPAAFTAKGYLFVSINYRLIPDVTLEEQVGDVAKAVRWIHKNIERYGGSPEDLYIMGHSAGAHLAALLCTDERFLKAEGLSLKHIKGCIPVDSAMFDAVEQVKSGPRLMRRTYRSAFGEDPEKQKKYSPASHVAKDKSIPPFLILYVASRKDSSSQAKRFGALLKEAGVAVTLVPCEEKNHLTINREMGEPGDKPTLAVFDFLSPAGK